MCGIVGLFLKTPQHEPELGRITARMLGTMCARGPDSAGFAVYGPRRDNLVKLTLRGPAGMDFQGVHQAVTGLFPASTLEVRASHAIMAVPETQVDDFIAFLKTHAPQLDLVGRGRRMELFKEVGAPDMVAERFGLAEMAGTHAIGHTRMATESAVTTDGAHPFSTGLDQCLVHNGSLSNHNGVRRNLIREGMTFETDNDSEVAAGYLTGKMRAGLSLGQALESSLRDLDGFYTFVVGTENGFGVLRDKIACKPAILAETADYVAFGSEYRALAGLPGIDAAKIWEPEPAIAYFWER